MRSAGYRRQEKQREIHNAALPAVSLCERTVIGLRLESGALMGQPVLHGG